MREYFVETSAGDWTAMACGSTFSIAANRGIQILRSGRGHVFENKKYLSIRCMEITEATYREWMNQRRDEFRTEGES